MNLIIPSRAAWIIWLVRCPITHRKVDNRLYAAGYRSNAYHIRLSRGPVHPAMQQTNASMLTLPNRSRSHSNPAQTPSQKTRNIVGIKANSLPVTVQVLLPSSLKKDMPSKRFL